MPYDPHYHARMLLSRVPDEIRKSISTEELNDRLVEAARLGAQANDPALSDELRKAARLRGQAVLQAQPREATRQQHAELIAKAAATPHRGQADAIRRQAEELISEQHPIAPRRSAAVLKAKADAEEMPVPVFDADGNLLGIVDQDDITLVAGSGSGSKAPPAVGGTDTAGAAAAAAQDPALDGQVVKALGSRMVVRDQHGRRYLTERRSIRSASSKVIRKALDADMVTLYDSGGRPYQVSRSAIRTPEEQARDTGPVRLGGTTGMGQPRHTGPAAALPADGPQQASPGDLDRMVIKALRPGWTAVHDWRGRLVGAAKTSNVIASPRAGTVAKSRIDHTHANVYDAARRKVGMAPLSHIIPVADLRKAVGTARPGGRAGR